ncbi:hypothetical protein SteCoe_7370 [Stentor coeruleus]|uniref:Kinesin motor domain-containing protein n=1 Tax=Stentor coeruleus TaxID=5963 RepID=A0A1R2CML9_9CILI|nr:hypothetical protein SteCoe_7370 [Stentor coeruleus]
MGDQKDNVKVAIRVRPLNDRERQESAKIIVTIPEPNKSVAIDIKSEQKCFTFDYVASEEIDQGEIFDKVGRPIADSCLSGYNGTIFAYGQTGAGKTFTILGPTIDSAEDFKFSSENSKRGLLPRCFEYIFSKIMREMLGDETEFLVKCSYLEIYQEQINDLLDPNPQNLQLREDMKRGVYVEGLIEETVTNALETYNLLKIGTLNRHVGSTSMNKESSRSHSVFTLVIESKTYKEGLNNYKTSHFHLIDLAGSERQKATDCAGERLKEAGMINKSLSALGNVINSLVDISEGKSRHVHYRDSKLTFLLKDSLGGNSKTFLVANISPAFSAAYETLSTLKFAQRAKQIKNVAVINEETSGAVALLRFEIKRLKEELLLCKDNTTCGRCGGLSLTEDLNENIYSILDKTLKQKKGDSDIYNNQINEKNSLIGNLNNTIERLERKINHSKMILKFRDATISRYQTNNPNKDKDIEELSKEIEVLREEVENNPNLARLYVENEKLRGEISEKLIESENKSRIAELEEISSKLAEELKNAVEVKEEIMKKYEESKETILKYEENIKNTTENIIPVYEILDSTKEITGTSVEDQDKILSLEMKIQKLQIKNSELQEKCQKKSLYKDKYKKYINEQREYTEKYEEINKKSKELNEENLKLQDEKQKLNEKVQKLIQEKQELNDELIKSQEVWETKNNLEKSLKEYEILEIARDKENLDNLSKENTSLKMQLKKTENEMGITKSELSTQIEKFSTINSRLNCLQISYQNLESKHQSLEKENNSLKNLLSDHDSLLESLKSTSESLSNTQTTCYHLSEELAEQKSSNETLLQAHNLSKFTIDDLTITITKLTQESQFQKKSSETLLKTLESTQSELLHAKNINKECQSFKQINEDLNKKLESSLKQQQSLENTINTLRNEISKAKTDKETLIFDTKIQQNHLEQEIFELQENKLLVNELQTRCQGLQDELNDTKSSLENFQELNLNLTQKNAELSNSLGKMHSSHVPIYIVDQLRQELKDVQEQNISLKEENKKKLEILKSIKSSITSTKNEISMWKKSIDEKNAVILELRNEIRRLKDNESEGSEAKFLRTALEEKELELKELKEKGQEYYSQADEALENMRRKCLSLQNEANSLREELRTCLITGTEKHKNPIQHNSDEITLRREDFLTMKTVNNKLTDELKVNVEFIEALKKQNTELGKKALEEGQKRQQLEDEVGNLTNGLAKITNYVFSLPRVRCNPEENSIVDSTIKAIGHIYKGGHKKVLSDSENYQENLKLPKHPRTKDMIKYKKSKINN